MSTERTGESVYQNAENEAQEIAALIPAKGIPVEQRARQNTLVREKLIAASDLTLVGLMNDGHQLSRVELVRRLRQGEITQFQALFELMIPVPWSRIDPYNDKLFRLAYKFALERSSTVPQNDFIDASMQFMLNGVMRDSDFFEDILSFRPDIKEVMTAVEERLKKEGRGRRDLLPQIGESAERKRAARMNAESQR